VISSLLVHCLLGKIVVRVPQGDDFCQASFESRLRGKLDRYVNHTMSEGPVWVKPRKAQSEQISSALPQSRPMRGHF
jgi:hypothetical protein